MTQYAVLAISKILRANTAPKVVRGGAESAHRRQGPSGMPVTGDPLNRCLTVTWQSSASGGPPWRPSCSLWRLRRAEPPQSAPPATEAPQPATETIQRKDTPMYSAWPDLLALIVNIIWGT